MWLHLCDFLREICGHQKGEATQEWDKGPHMCEAVNSFIDLDF